MLRLPESVPPANHIEPFHAILDPLVENKPSPSVVEAFVHVIPSVLHFILEALPSSPTATQIEPFQATAEVMVRNVLFPGSHVSPPSLL